MCDINLKINHVVENHKKRRNTNYNYLQARCNPLQVYLPHGMRYVQ